ncbi:translocase of chloroplast 159, chloroplastic [Juglans microcarpa x Juglans regia]|uniref:translocase of chloroplast 159, chloroplastic n=1 Tax=Juglans microcarpa x Juglans regia TaxID=2249226 RepID=UPI001B7E52D3|nr:translocase of chloroplast 159, chloroplastic [Juglans microcarpa x Juglans regia]
MDPNASAPEGTSLLSNSSGSRFSFPTSYSLDSDGLDNSMKNYALEVDNDKDNGGGGGYGNEGFGNGDDGLENLEEASGGDYTDAPSFGSSVFSRQKSVSVRPVAKVSADDDDDDEDENYVVQGGNLGDLEVEEDERGVASEIVGVEGSVGNWGIGGAVLEQKGLSENGSLGELGIGSGIADAHKGSSEFLVGGVEDKVFENAKWIEDLGSVGELKGEEAVEELKSEGLDGEESVVVTETEEAAVATKESTTLGVGPDQPESVNIKPVDDKLLELDGVKFTTGGDSVVEDLNVNLSKAGAIVVGDVEEIEDADIRGLEVPVRGGITLDNGFDQISGDAKERVDLKSLVVGTESDQIVEPINKFGIDAAGVGIYGERTSVAEVEKVENFDINTAIVEEDKQDDITTYVEEGGTVSLVNAEKKPEGENEPQADSEDKQKELAMEIATAGAETLSMDKLDGGEGVETREIKLVPKVTLPDSDEVEGPLDNGVIGADAQVDEARVSGETDSIQSVELSSILSREIKLESQDEENQHSDMEDQVEGSFTDGENDGMIFGSSEAAKQFLEELERGSGAESSRDHSQRLDGQIVTDSDEEVDTDEEGDGKELFDSAALAALLKAATGAGSDDGSITITSQDGSRLFSVERPAGLGSSLRSVKPAPRQNRSNLFTPDLTVGDNSENNLSEEDKKKLENLQQIRVKFLRLVQRLGVSPEESIAAQVLYRMALIAGRQSGHLFSLEAAKRTSLLLEAEGKDDLSFSLNILVLGKSGVGKSATINSIFGEDKTLINAFGPATTDVKEIVGTVDGVKIRVFDTPGLNSSALEQGINRRILSSVKKLTKKCPPDIVLYVDRLDAQTRDLNDLPLLRSIASSLGSSIWRTTIITLTHAASAPPDGPSGTPLRYDAYVAQRSHVVQQTIGQAVGDLRLMNPSLMMTPVSLVENHPSCRKNREGQKILPNGLSWRPQLLLLCYSMKILSEVNNLSKPQELFDHRKLFGFRTRSPPLPYLLSWLLQSRTHPKLSADQGGDNGDSDIDLDDLSDSEQAEEEDEYDQLPPFKPLRKYQIAKLSKEQKKAYFEEYEYRVKLLQKKQWREELKRLREMKKKGKVNAEDYGFDGEDDGENGSPAAVPVVLPDTALPPSFDGDNPSYRYRFLEPISQFVTRPVLDTHGWDHDCGYDGVNLEQSLAIASRFPAAVTVQITKDKKEFNLHVDSAVSAKHGENGSSMAGFDIQTIGKQLAYIVRGETKFKNLKKNKTTAGVSLTFLGENVSTGVKIEDQIALGKRLVLVGSTGTVRSQGDSAYGANLEVRFREADYPIGQDQSSLGLSLVKWKGDTALGANFQSQISIGRSYKVAVRAGLNNKLSGQITVRTSSSDQLQLALVGILPIVRAIYKIIWPGASENYSIY